MIHHVPLVLQGNECVLSPITCNQSLLLYQFLFLLSIVSRNMATWLHCIPNFICTMSLDIEFLFFFCIMSLDSLFHLYYVSWHRFLLSLSLDTDCAPFCSVSVDMQFILYNVAWQYLSIDIARYIWLLFLSLVQFQLFSINTKWIPLGIKQWDLPRKASTHSDTPLCHYTIHICKKHCCSRYNSLRFIISWTWLFWKA